MGSKAAAAAEFEWFDDLSMWILDEEADAPVYDMLAGIRRAHHQDTLEARIVLALKSYAADVDGHMKLGECIKVPEIYQRLAGVDCIIALHKEVWPRLKPEQQRALMDHELCHLAPKLDPKTLDQAETADGIKQWRLVKHDLEEFGAIVRRHGFWEGSLQNFALAVTEAQRHPLFREQIDEALDREIGAVVSIDKGRKR